MDVCYVFDEGYIGQFKVAAYSLVESNRGEEIVFHLLTHALGEEACEDIADLMRKLGARYERYDIDETLFAALPELRGSYATYYKLLIFRYLGHLPEVLYLDCDIVVRKPIKALFSVEADKGLVAVLDKHVNRKEEAHVIAVNGAAGGYFNAGVLLFRFARFERIPAFDEMISYAAQHAELLTFHDQDVFNHFFAASCGHADEAYDYFAEYFHWYEVVVSDKRKAAIVHYAGQKPWDRTYTGKYYGLYKKYYKACARLTPLGFMQKRCSVFVRAGILIKRLLRHVGRKFKRG